MPKTCENQFHKNIRVVCEKNSGKKHQIFEKREDFENGPFKAKAIAHAKTIAFAKWSF